MFDILKGTSLYRLEVDRGMTNFRFIHAADLHLDSPFKGIGGRVPESVFRRLRDSTFAAFDRLVRLCIDESIDFLCIAGDVFDLADRSLRAQTHFQKRMRELDRHGIQVYVIHGNHDPADGGKVPLDWPDNVHFFSADKVESVPFVKGGREVARLYGRSYPTAKFTERIVEDYPRDPNVPFAIGLLHTNLDGDPSHDNYAPCSKKQLLGKGFDYWALGHIHQAAVLSEREPCIVYAGNTQGRSVKETGPKGCYLVDVRDGTVDRVDFRETDDVRWHEIDLDLTGIGEVQNVLDRIQEALERIADRSQKRAAVVRLNLTGVTPVHQQMHPVDRLLELLEPYLDDFVQRENWLFVESVRLHTQPFISRETLLEGEGFLSDYLRLIEQVKNSPAEVAAMQEEVLHAVYGHREGRKYLEQLSEEEVKQLLDEVQDMAVRMFSR